MLIRHAREDDWADVVRIEQDNFSPEEAATPEAIEERLKKISDKFIIIYIDTPILFHKSTKIISIHFTLYEFKFIHIS